MAHKQNFRFAFGNIAEPIPFGKESLPIWKQVHGTAVVEVQTSGQALGECDGVFTRVDNLPIAVISADCVPILLAKKDGSAVAALHAGWRGTYARIIEQFCSILKSKNEIPAEWTAMTGPSIRSCCYEVSPELILDFKNTFKEHDPSKFVFRDRYLDLVALNTLELEKHGFGDIQNQSPCTACSKTPGGEYLYHSFRREKASVRQYSVIQILSK